MIATPPAISHLVAERIEALGLPLLRINAKGVAKSTGPCSWFERNVIESPLMARAIQANQSVLQQIPSRCVTLFPGVFMVGLAVQEGVEDTGDWFAVLMLGPQIIQSEILRLHCDQAGLDWQATTNRIERERFVSETEAQRIAMALGWMQNDVQGIAVHRCELRQISEELANNYEELSLLYKLSCSMSLEQSPVEFFNNACVELQEVSGFGWIALQITDKQPRLQQLRGAIYTAGNIDSTKPFRQLGRELIRRCNGSPNTTIIDDTSSMDGVARHVGNNLLIVPLVREGQTLGVLFGGDRNNQEHIDSVDAKLCASLCNTLAIFLENLMFLEDAQSMFIGTLHALTSAIDAKDSYTFGHSERVALLSEMLARAAGIDEAIVERIYIAGLVHDVGKIGVPESVLAKPGRLTDEEFDQIKMHPEIGARILRDIRQMQDLIPGVMYHHERWDGKGYPEKRMGLDIPLFGRVIGLADAFDAMSSDRTYRSALNIHQVLQEIKDCKGSQFDPELADVFLELNFEPYLQMIQRHHAVKLSDSRNEHEAAVTP